MTRFLLFAIILLSFSHINSKLYIRKPEILAEQFDKIKGIDYRSFVTPDKLNFNRTLVGHLIKADNDDACQPLQPLFSEGPDAIINPVVIATRDHCRLGHKVANAQAAGASMLIIVVDSPNLPERGHHQHHIRHANIEVVIIKKSDGDKIFEFMEKALTEPSHETAFIELVFTLDEENAGITPENTKNNTVVLDFWLSSSDTSENTYRILEDFKPVWDHFEGVRFTPRYVTWECDTCRAGKFSKSDDQCLSYGRYCDPEPAGENIRGNEVILEDLRQICIFNHDEELWWSYIAKFGQLCSSQQEANFEICGDEVFAELKTEDKKVNAIKKCMADSFKAKVGDDLKTTPNDNQILRENYDLMNRMGVNSYPSLYANWNMYNGNLFNRKDLLQFVCSHFINVPSTCNNAVPFIPTETESVELVLFLVFSVTVVIMIAVVCYVRMRVKRTVYMEMKDEVGGIVAQYRQFKDRANTSTTIEMAN